MAQQGIYVSPDNIVPNRDRGNKQNLYLYVCKYNIAYGNGMVLVAARNPMRAMEILEATNRKDDYGYSVESSRELGFNAVERCKYCGKPATHEGLCEKCYNMRNY